MTDYRNENIDPEDFWPDAEKLLDQHFVAKKRRRGIIIFLIAFLIGGSLTSYFYSTIRVNNQVENLEKKNNPVEKIETAAEKNMDYNIQKNTNNNKISSTNNTSKIENEKVRSNNNVSSSDSKFKKPKQISNNPTLIVANKNNIQNSIVALPENKNTIIPNTILRVDKITSELKSSISFVPTIKTIALFENITLDSISVKFNIKKEKQKRRLDLIIYGGGIYLDNKLNSESNVTYIQRRNREEQPIIAPNFGASVSTGKGKWDLRAGLEFSMLGEKIKYSPFSDGDYYESYGDWQPTQYSYTDSDSTFIFGNLYINTTIVTINDSTYQIVTDTVNGAHYDESITNGNGTNKFYYIELPIELAYTTFNRNWGFGISAGISPAFLIASDGYYLTADQHQIKKISKKDHTQLHLNGRLNLELSYNINEKVKLLFRPNARMNLTKIVDSETVKHNYTSIGFNTGLIYKLSY